MGQNTVYDVVQLALDKLSLAIIEGDYEAMQNLSEVIERLYPFVISVAELSREAKPIIPTRTGD